MDFQSPRLVAKTPMFVSGGRENADFSTTNARDAGMLCDERAGEYLAALDTVISRTLACCHFERSVVEKSRSSSSRVAFGSVPNATVFGVILRCLPSASLRAGLAPKEPTVVGEDGDVSTSLRYARHDNILH